MATMSHSPAQRKAWHDGKKKKGENLIAWYRRAIIKGGNMRGAFTPKFMTRGIFYKPK